MPEPADQIPCWKIAGILSRRVFEKSPLQTRSKRKNFFNLLQGGTHIMKEIIQGFYQKKHFWSRLILVVIAVILMGFALSWLLLVDLGTDPCTLLNKSISAHLGMSIGNWQAIFNTILLIFVILFGGRNLGFGTLANMFLVGYSIDFFSWIWAKILPPDLFTSMGVRIAVLIPALILFILAAAFYMDMDMGTAPYDAVSFIISTHLPNVSFRVVRIVYDFVVTALAVLLGGKLGIVTVLMVVTLGPVIEWLGNILKRHLNLFDD